MRVRLSFRQFCLLGLATATAVYVFHCYDRKHDVIKCEGRTILISAIVEARQARKHGGVTANEARQDRKQHGSMQKKEPRYDHRNDLSVPETDNSTGDSDQLTKRFLDSMNKPDMTIANVFTNEEFVSILLHMISSIKYTCNHSRRMGVPFPEDGGYDVCFDVDIKPGNCIVYSVGIRNMWSFDDAMANYGCNVYCFDPFNGLKTHRRSERVMFYDIALCGDDEEERKFEIHDTALCGDDEGERIFIGKHPPVRCRTLESLKKMLHHEKEVIDVLKFDIEGSEFECLPQMIESGVLASVKQLVFEIHMVKPIMKRVIDSCQHLAALQQEHSFELWYSFEPFAIQNHHFGEFSGSNYATFELGLVNTHFLKNGKQ
ncbi:uncharacterized protein [Ptychodera flava]|uniref:uncharacterized protein isoform X1 n=1 Tax=Ptychodera flava TaxID=63121 RepID=UPI00396A2B82